MMYVEFTLANTDGSPICLPVGSFYFTLNIQGGTNLHLSSGQTVHVDEAYEAVIYSLSRLHVRTERAPEFESDIEDLIADITASDSEE
jgi:hypothetical protein